MSAHPDKYEDAGPDEDQLILEFIQRVEKKLNNLERRIEALEAANKDDHK